jgi:uncharacterized surface protein with fasciclin (FAS1) repeats
MRNTLLKKLVLLLLPLTLLACQSKMEKYYEVPEWLRGSAWAVLQEEGNYTIFLEGVERAGFRPILEGKSIVTLMVPDDAAFNAYFSANGITSISAMNADELKKLIGFHLFYYSYDKSMLINFLPEGQEAGEVTGDINAGLYYKFRTRSGDAPTQEYDRASNKTRTVYHLERFAPVFSYRFFETKGIDAKSNYEFFYPGSTWTGDEIQEASKGFNVSNASVNEYEIVADNGYIYKIDRVLEPLETIYNEMKNNPSYSSFTSLYDVFSNYRYESNLTADYGTNLGVDSLFLHDHNGLVPIALEWPIPLYTAMTTLASVGYTVFAPNNEALDQFYRDFWQPGGYESLEMVDSVAKMILVGLSTYGGEMIFPEEIENGKVTDDYGNPLDFSMADVADRAICVNGSFYGLTKMNTPPLLTSIMGPAFQNKGNRSFLYTLWGSGLIRSYGSSTMNYVMLIPSDAQMETSGYFLRDYDSGPTALAIETEDGWVNLSANNMLNISSLHAATGSEPLKTSGKQVYVTNSPFNYWYVKDGKITSSERFNRLMVPGNTEDPFVPFTEITRNGQPWNNGRAYSYDTSDGIFVSTAGGDGLSYRLAVVNDKNYAYNTFAQLLRIAGMATIGGTEAEKYVTGLSYQRFIAFIPTEQAVRTALAANAIPGITGGSIGPDGEIVVDAANLNQTTLRNYLNHYILRDTENAIPTYPYPGSVMQSGSYKALYGRGELIYTDTGSALKVQIPGRNEVNVIPDYDYFPFAFRDGGFHFIDAIL